MLEGWSLVSACVFVFQVDNRLPILSSQCLPRFCPIARWHNLESLERCADRSSCGCDRPLSFAPQLSLALLSVISSLHRLLLLLLPASNICFSAWIYDAFDGWKLHTSSEMVSLALSPVKSRTLRLVKLGQGSYEPERTSLWGNLFLHPR